MASNSDSAGRLVAVRSATTFSGSLLARGNPGNEEAGPCKKLATKACQDCRLVLYCSPGCQKSHWPEHRKDCRSAFMKGTWKPGWVRDHRDPTFVSGETAWSQALHGTKKYLWGNVPALDIINLKANEGEHHKAALNVLFAASGDLRSAVISVARLPEAYQSPLTVVLNDFDMDVTARNVVLLLIFFAASSAKEAAHHTLHLLYSALISQESYSFLQDKIKPLVEGVLAKIASKGEGVLLAKTWRTGRGCSLRVELPKDKWTDLVKYLTVPADLDKSTAQRIRSEVMAAAHRADHSDRFLLFQQPDHRASFAKFRGDGILLPFGHPRAVFDTPNPTFFQNGDKWPMMDSADPMHGWDLKAVLETNSGPATNDVYGKLCKHISDIFRDFYRQLEARELAFRIHMVNARLLPVHLTSFKFDRIDTSNIPDMCHMGTHATLTTFAPLLRVRSVNPCATIITLYLNAVREAALHLDDEQGHQHGYIEAAAVYLGPPSLRTPEELRLFAIKTTCSIEQLWDMDALFSQYTDALAFPEIGLYAGVQMRKSHRVVAQWPLRFQRGPPTPEKCDEFRRLLSSGHSGSERYVEWELLDEPPPEEMD